MPKPILKKCIIQYHHTQDKLFFFQVKLIEMLDVATQSIKSVPAKTLDEAIMKIKMYINEYYSISDSDFLVRKDPKPTQPKGNN